MKNITVIGLGTFGFNLAIELTRQGNQVLAIDKEKEIVESIKNFVTDAIVANTMDKDVLSEFVGNNIDIAILGLGEQYMEATVLTIVHLKELGIEQIIVKSMNELRGKVFMSIGATEVIYPEKETALRLARRLTIPTLIDQIPIAPEYSIVEIALPDGFVGKSICELNLRQKYGVTIIAIKDILRDELIPVPSADQVFAPDTALIVLGRHRDIEKLKRFM